jgi:hypothetical protein
LISVEIRETREFASEVKYLVSAAQGAAIERWATRWLSADPNGGQYAVTSLYFDTADRRVLNRHGSFGRAKYRIRRYGDSQKVFLERKLRTNQVVVKRRSLVDMDDLALLDTSQLDRHWRPGNWFQQRLQARALRPAWQISYQRTARQSESHLGPIRLTLDRDLAAAPIRSIAFEDEGTTPLFGDGEMILELKFRRAMPELFHDLVDEFSLRAQPVSKFRLAATTLSKTETVCA